VLSVLVLKPYVIRDVNNLGSLANIGNIMDEVI